MWGAAAVSQLGTALGAGALPLVAILIVHASDLQLTLMAALSGAAAAAVALPLGPFVEFRRRRAIMVQTDLISFAALASVPVAAWLGVLTYGQLCVVATVSTLCTIVFSAASGAYLKSLVPEQVRIRANSRLETVFWTVSTIGAPIGGALISMFGATATILIDAVSYLLSALGLRSIATPEPAPDHQRRDHHWTTEIRSGWSYIFAHPVLHRLFWNAMLFGGSLMLTGPLMALLMLRELGFAPWQYGLALGLPTLGGLAGSLCAPRLVTRLGDRAVLLGFGVLRTCWLGLMLAAHPGTAGLIVITTADTLLLFCAGVFNPVFTTYRMNATTDDHMARVGTAWSISSKTFQPAFIALGGLLAAATSTRVAIACAAITLLASSLLLPWRQTTTSIPRLGG
ncbi:MFS transporter [Nocardia sp. NBC_00508]|uniref:MFS transporter n=1 Tax=Nocardia sp. NBC_00508 TaxID=2975992 RepID=UPI002E81D7DE|nr:MFS transporter [Nocardia sp. NBC_00508]WUD66142.1 MFS transporter [Nocardia sp. NBC_00508]